jgi:hypothetical protein
MESEKALDAVDLICSSAELFADRKLVAEPLNNIAKYMFDSRKTQILLFALD